MDIFLVVLALFLIALAFPTLVRFLPTHTFRPVLAVAIAAQMVLIFALYQMPYGILVKFLLALFVPPVSMLIGLSINDRFAKDKLYRVGIAAMTVLLSAAPMAYAVGMVVLTSLQIAFWLVAIASISCVAGAVLTALLYGNNPSK